MVNKICRYIWGGSWGLINITIINGYYARGATHIEPSGRRCFKFVVISTVPNSKKGIAIECKAFDAQGDYCYANLSEGCYVEVVGQIDRYSKNHAMYVLVTSLTIQKPKARRQMQMRTTDFLQTYQPASVLKRLSEQAEKKRKEEEQNE